jgi:hypothetical protein
VDQTNLLTDQQRTNEAIANRETQLDNTQYVAPISEAVKTRQQQVANDEQQARSKELSLYANKL